MSEEQKQVAPSATQAPDCPTCRGNGMIGGPSYYASGEGGVPCPDCWVPSAGKDAQPVGVAGKMPGTDGFTMACFKAVDVPFGTLLYAAPAAKNGPDERTVLRDLAQALAWQSFGECRGYSERLLSPIDALAAARDVLGLDAAHAAPQAQPSDDEIEALAVKYIATNAEKLREIAPHMPSYQQTEQFHRVKAMITEVLSRYGAAPQAGEDARPVAWSALTDEDRQAAFESMPDMLDGFLKKWGWLNFAKEIERRCKEKNAVATPQPAAQVAPAVPDGFALGIKAAARWVDDRRFNFDLEHGYTDPETGAFEYGRGPAADAKAEYSYELAEIAEGIRALTTQGASLE